jgi:hypothetical protein
MPLITKEQMLELLKLPLEPGESPAGRLEMLWTLATDPEELEDEEGDEV